MAAVDKKLLFPVGSVGNATGSSFELETIVQILAVGLQFVVEAAGATPTVTFKYQGSLDNVTWTDIPYITGNSDTVATTTQVVTAVGTTVNFLDLASGSRYFKYFRCVTTANTNITYRAELYVFSLPR